MYFENIGRYTFKPYAFSVSSRSQWNVMTTADLNGDGLLDVIIGAMRLENIGRLQRGFGQPSEPGIDPILLFENKIARRSRPPPCRGAGPRVRARGGGGGRGAGGVGRRGGGGAVRIARGGVKRQR